MRGTRRFAWGFLCVALLMLGGPARAAEPSGKFELSPFLGGIVFDHDLDAGHKLIGGGRLGYWLSDRWAVELSGEGSSDRTDGGRPLDYLQTHVDALYHLNYSAQQRLVPYLAAGLGVANYQFGRTFDDGSTHDDFDFLTIWGGGLKYLVTDWLALRVDARQPVSWNKTNHHFLYTGGVSFLFGGKAPPPPPPADTDGDGVPDDADRCPGTPAGVTVDASGCPLDSDGDGVADYLDKCPNTPPGTKVDAVGCPVPVDSDGDGVTDDKDKCPGTPRGVAVDATGCPIPQDSDGDGVTDDKDKCPGTPRGVAVDATGCPLDSDGDGVTDDKDKCPGTPRGVAVDATGCPLDSDGDGVTDDKDKCPDTPRGAPVDATGCLKDTDGDGLTDWDETQKYGTDPNNADTDGDRLKDGEEVLTYKTDPKKADTDGGTVPDGEEVLVKKTNPLDPKDDVEVVELRINFDFDKADVKPQYLPQVEKVAAFLKAHPAYSAVIEGHTDSAGPEEYNLNLSARRANAVAKILTEKYGIALERITAQSLGESKPIASNDTREGRAQNRRIYAYMDRE